jgi:phosphonate transport system substrate-binding protein
MRRKATNFVFLGVCFCALIWTGGPPSLAQAGEGSKAREETIVVGVVSDDPKKRLPSIQVMSKYLAIQLRDLGIRRGAARIAPDNATMVRLLRAGRVDIVSETAFSALHFVAEGGGEILLREWKKGIAEYRTVFIRRRDSDIRSLADLRGRKIAFEDPGSTTGYLLPLAILKDQGLDTLQIAPRAPAPADGVGYAFAHDEINIATWVARGITDAGAFSNQDWEDIVRTPQPLKMDLVVFHSSEPLLRSTILAGPGLSAEIKRRLKDILLRMDKHPAGRDVLKTYNKVAKYDAISGVAAQSLDRARRLLSLVRDEVDR